MIVIVGSLLPIALAVGFISRTGLRITSEMERDGSLAGLSGAALVGAVSGLVASVAGLPVDVQIIAALLGAFLATGAAIDRSTGWAPDFVMLPCCILALIFGGEQGAWDMGAVHSIMLGLGIYFALHTAWLAFAKIAPRLLLLPPADILALAIPVMMFGVSFALVGCMMTISAILLACLIFPRFGSLFRDAAVADEVIAEASADASPDQTVTFLAVGFPVTALVMCASFLM